MGTHLNVSSLTLLLTVFLLTSNGPTHARSEEAVVDPMTFFVGEWALTLRDAEGNIVGKAKSLGYPVLDGTMLQIDYRSLDPAGNIVFRETTLRTRKPSGEGWVVRWAMSDLEGHTYIDEEWRAAQDGGALHGTGRGFDAGGEFLERYRYFEMSPDGYSFQLERSVDGGATWTPGPVAKAVPEN